MEWTVRGVEWPTPRRMIYSIFVQVSSEKPSLPVSAFFGDPVATSVIV